MDLHLVLGVDRHQRQGIGRGSRVTIGLDVEEIVALIHILVELPVGADAFGEEGAVKHIHALHHSLHSLAQDLHIHDAGIIQHKTHRIVVELPQNKLAALAAASLDDFR